MTIGTIPKPKDQPMPGLTVTEKEHWKERISRRIDKRIEAVHAADPNMKDRIDREARERALASLGLTELQREADDVERQEAHLEERGKQITKTMLARVRGVPASSIDGYVYNGDTEIENAVKRRQKVHEEDLLAECEAGKQVLALRKEREELLDTVWLATSGKDIRALWQKVGDLLGDQITKLQSEALTIEPASEV